MEKWQENCHICIEKKSFFHIRLSTNKWEKVWWMRESEWSTFHLGTFFSFKPNGSFFVGEPQTLGPLLRRLCCLFNGKGLSEKAPGYWISRDREEKETENQSIQTLIRIEGVLYGVRGGLTPNPKTLTTKKIDTVFFVVKKGWQKLSKRMILSKHSSFQHDQKQI